MQLSVGFCSLASARSFFLRVPATYLSLPFPSHYHHRLVLDASSLNTHLPTLLLTNAQGQVGLCSLPIHRSTLTVERVPIPSFFLSFFALQHSLLQSTLSFCPATHAVACFRSLPQPLFLPSPALSHNDDTGSSSIFDKYRRPCPYHPITGAYYTSFLASITHKSFTVPRVRAHTLD
jgi:hypothetical protein